jgi:hypothetical protein
MGEMVLRRDANPEARGDGIPDCKIHSLLNFEFALCSWLLVLESWFLVLDSCLLSLVSCLLSLVSCL